MIKKILLILILVGGIAFVGNMFLQQNQDNQMESEVSEVEAPESEQVTATETSDNELAPQSEFEIDMDNYTFSESEIVVRAGEKITIKLNTIEGNHDLIIDELDVRSEHFKTGESGEMTFTVGEEHIGNTYEFYCSVGSHRALGMVGKITIVE